MSIHSEIFHPIHVLINSLIFNFTDYIEHPVPYLMPCKIDQN